VLNLSNCSYSSLDKDNDNESQNEIERERERVEENDIQAHIRNTSMREVCMEDYSGRGNQSHPRQFTP
jgi:hypothetical protein